MEPFSAATTRCGLPEDCLQIIFEKLDSSADRNAFGLTCRSWLLIQSLARRSLSFQFSYNPSIYRVYARYLPLLLSRFRHLISISLAGFVELPDLALAPLQQSGWRLQSLSLYCCLGITDKGITLVAEACPQLVSLTLYRCNITDIGLELLARSCQALEKVNLSYCNSVSDGGLRGLCRGCKKLEALVISYCRGITGVGFEGCPASLTFLEAESCLLTPEGLLLAVSGGGLEYLNLSGLRSWVRGDGLDGLRFAKRIRILNLRSCRFVGDDSVAAIAAGCGLLEEWSLALCHEVRARGWRGVAAGCQNLKALHVNRCRNLSDDGLRAIREGCPRLRKLHIHGCYRVSESGLEMFKLHRQDVLVREAECISIGPRMEELFA